MAKCSTGKKCGKICIHKTRKCHIRKRNKGGKGTVTFKNGAVAKMLPSGKYRIISGASPAYMRKISKMRGKKGKKKGGNCSGSKEQCGYAM
jgi:hypothetical protein